MYGTDSHAASTSAERGGAKETDSEEEDRGTGTERVKKKKTGHTTGKRELGPRASKVAKDQK